MTDKQETAPAEANDETVETVSAKVVRPFHGVITADGKQGWAHPGDVLEVAPARRAELLSAELIEREKGDPAPEQGNVEPIEAQRDKTRKLNVTGTSKAKA